MKIEHWKIPGIWSKWSESLFIVVEVDSKIVSWYNISIIRNLTRNLRPYGLIENVITDSNYRKRGDARKALNMAVSIAKDKNYKVMFLTGD